jgi:glycerophosphoryl diester phosphodiesterase
MTRPLLLGHRGARGTKSIPENTLASFDRALADGCDGFEFDVRRSADGEAVICHDATSGGVEISSAAAEDLPALPRLAEVLDRYLNAFLDIELKVSGLESIVIDLLHGRRRDTFVVSSFLREVLEDIYSADANIPLGLLCETKAQLRGWDRMPVRYLVPHYRLVERKLVNEAHAANKKVLVWTVNTPARMTQLARWGVDGIISDNTRQLCATLRRASSADQFC